MSDLYIVFINIEEYIGSSFKLVMEYFRGNLKTWYINTEEEKLCGLM